MNARCIAVAMLAGVACAAAPAVAQTGKVPAQTKKTQVTPPTLAKVADRPGRFVPTGPPANDLCENAIGPLTIPSTTAGTTLGATIDAVPGAFCGTSVNTAGVWYSVIGTGSLLTASTCDDADYDTKISIFCSGCDTLTCVTGQDDNPACSGFTTELSWCAEAGVEYLILVHGFGGDTGNFNLTITDEGLPCAPAVECAGIGACCLPDPDLTCVETLPDLCADMGGAYIGNGEPCETVVGTYAVGDLISLAIPDNDPGGVSTTLSIAPTDAVVHDLDVNLQIDHTWVGDLIVSLEHDGVVVPLIDRPGVPDSAFGCDADNYDIILNDEGDGGPIEDACEDDLASPPSYTPNNPLSAFDGHSRSGDWILHVSDNAGGDTGTIVSWTLEFNTIETPCVDCNDNLLADPVETLPENLPIDAIAQDDCWDAELIGPGIVYIDNTFGATNDGDPFCGNLFGVDDVWYRVRTTWTGHAFIELNGPPFSWRLSVYDGCPNGLVPNEITCNDINPNGVTWYAERGWDYYIRIAAENFEQGWFRMRMVGPATNLNLTDFNGDEVPDDCQCLFDVDGDNDVDLTDFQLVLISFGECGGPCPADVDYNGVVDHHDAQLVWLAIGTPCP